MLSMVSKEKDMRKGQIWQAKEQPFVAFFYLGELRPESKSNLVTHLSQGGPGDSQPPPDNKVEDQQQEIRM